MYQIFAFVDGQFKTPLENFISSGTSNIASWVTGTIDGGVDALCHPLRLTDPTWISPRTDHGFRLSGN